MRLEIFLTVLRFFGGIFQGFGTFEANFRIKIFLIKKRVSEANKSLFKEQMIIVKTSSRGGIP